MDCEFSSLRWRKHFRRLVVYPETPDPKPTAKYSDEDFDRMFNQKFAKMMAKHEKEMAEATRLAEKNAQERAEHENKKLQEQVQELMRKEAIAEMSKSARAMLREKNDVQGG